MTLGHDGAAALQWLERYAERLQELPVLAQVSPGEVRAALPTSAPERGQAFDAVLGDLEHVLLPGLTTWQPALLRLLLHDGV